MTKAELLAENEKLKSRIAHLEQEVERLSNQLKEALSQLEAKGRAGKRQAAPFSKGKKKSKPKRPGRKKGHKPSHRAKPDNINQELNAPLKQSCCLAEGFGFSASAGGLGSGRSTPGKTSRTHL